MKRMVLLVLLLSGLLGIGASLASAKEDFPLIVPPGGGSYSFAFAGTDDRCMEVVFSTSRLPDTFIATVTKLGATWSFDMLSLLPTSLDRWPFTATVNMKFSDFKSAKGGSLNLNDQTNLGVDVIGSQDDLVIREIDTENCVESAAVLAAGEKDNPRCSLGAYSVVKLNGLRYIDFVTDVDLSTQEVNVVFYDDITINYLQVRYYGMAGKNVYRYIIDQKGLPPDVGDPDRDHVVLNCILVEPSPTP